MADNLVIVESPAKAKTIEKYLGKSFKVASSMGHIRDLAKKDFGINIEKNYKPIYVVPSDKKKVVSELKKMVKEAKYVWLASDEDREGEAIAWHIADELKLSSDLTRRIVFSEITENAIKNSINNYRQIDERLVDAQQARRILDRLVGFELSPVLWKKVKPSLSAGRVQSVAVRLIVEREREINDFEYTSNFKISGIFLGEDKNRNPFELYAETKKRIKNREEVMSFLETCKKSSFRITDIVKKPSKRTPSAPFTTSTLQQEAARKLGFSVSQTMSIAQKLYEAGYITYMRTDSVNLSSFALDAARDVILNDFGEKYSKQRHYKTKSKSAQEAHEAIRPTDMKNRTIKGNNAAQRLYELIWKRTLASQMADAMFEKTHVEIDISETKEKFNAVGEVLKFDGFLKVYIESTDDEDEEEIKGLLPPLEVNQEIDRKIISATEKYSNHPPRFTEASLVKKLEELGIGRPSTYAPTISTIQNRGYVLKEDREGKERQIESIVLKDDKINAEKKIEKYGTEKSKLFPDNIGMIVNDFLVKHFQKILDYNFTANVEKEFDEIAAGKKEWPKMIDRFYKPFHEQVERTLKESEYSRGERELGKDPKTGEKIIARMGRYGAMVQMGENDPENDKKPKYASLLKGQQLEKITLEEALDLFKLPRSLGDYEEKEMVVAIGRFGPYVRHNSKFVSLKKGIDDPFTITPDRAIELIKEKREADKNKYIKSFDNDPEMQVLNGRWGPYISYKKKNYKIPKDKDPKALSYDQCMELVKTGGAKKKAKKK